MSITFDTFCNNVIFNTNYYAAIAANWLACGKVNRARSMLRLQIVLDIDFLRTIYVRITRGADCYGQDDERGDFCFLIIKRKFPPQRVLIAI